MTTFPRMGRTEGKPGRRVRGRESEINKPCCFFLAFRLLLSVDIKITAHAFSLILHREYSEMGRVLTLVGKLQTEGVRYTHESLALCRVCIESLSHR